MSGASGIGPLARLGGPWWGAWDGMRVSLSGVPYRPQHGGSWTTFDVSYPDA